MYATHFLRSRVVTRSARRLISLSLAVWLLIGNYFALAQQQVIRNISRPTERLELTVNSSRIITLEKRIPRMVVNNPELVSVTPISANQVQLAALKPGVTQVNLWDEDDKVYTIDLMIYGDVRELELALERLFPESSVKVMRLTNSLVLEGFVERPEIVSPMVRLAEDYAPKIINNIQVGGVQQVMLKVKVMEVSRTKLRQLGFDFASFSNGDAIVSSISGIIQSFDLSGSVEVDAARETLSFGVVDGSDSFFGFLNALQANNVAKVLADPVITTLSGRPAKFLSGGQVPYIVPGGVGQPPQVNWEDFGTIVDFVPIVLGNGKIRLEVRPKVKDLDESLGINLDGAIIPGFRERSVDTGVELKAGQTLALAGLVQTKVNAVERGLPYISDVPYLGAAFRSVEEEVNEVELLILVTPEYVDGMDPHEVPPCGPGMETVSPSNCQLYMGGHLEVPSCGPCGPYGEGCYSGYDSMGSSSAIVSDVVSPTPMDPREFESYQSVPITVGPSIETTEPLQGTPSPNLGEPSGSQQPAEETMPDPAAFRSVPTWMQGNAESAMPRSYQNPQYRISDQSPPKATTTPGLIGPIGYDLEK